MPCNNIFKKEEKHTIDNLINKIRALNSVESSSDNVQHHDTDTNTKNESSITKFLNSIMGTSDKTDSQTDISKFMKKDYDDVSSFLRHVVPDKSDSQTNLSSFIRDTNSDTPFLKHITTETESEKDLKIPRGVLVRPEPPTEDITVTTPEKLKSENISVTTPEPLKLSNKNVSIPSNINGGHEELHKAICECVTNCKKCLLISCHNNMPECVKTSHDCQIILSQYINISNCCHVCYLVYILNMCILACTKCFTECIKHAEHHQICKLCAESCANVNKKILNYMRLLKNKMPVRQNNKIITETEHSSDISNHKDDSTDELKQYLINLSKQKQSQRPPCSKKHKSNTLRYY